MLLSSRLLSYHVIIKLIITCTFFFDATVLFLVATSQVRLWVLTCDGSVPRVTLGYFMLSAGYPCIAVRSVYVQKGEL